MEKIRLAAKRSHQRKRSSTLGRDILKRALSGSGVDDLIDGVSRLELSKELTLDIDLSKDHLTRESTGCQAHEIVKFWNREDIDSVDILWGKEERGEERKGIQWWRQKLLTKDLSEVGENRHTKKIPETNRSKLLKYLMSDDASEEWYKVQDFTERDVFPKTINAADVLQGDLGDCYFACAVSLCAEHYPTCIRKRIERTKNGYKVFLWSQRRGSCNSRSPLMKRGPIVTEISSLFYVHTRESRKGPRLTPLYLRSRSGTTYPCILEKVRC